MKKKDQMKMDEILEKFLKKIEYWLPALIVIGCFLGCSSMLIGFVTGIEWMIVAGFFLLAVSLAGKKLLL